MLDCEAIINVVVSHGLRSGHFERVNGHPPTNPPGNGISAGMWIAKIRPLASSSGLAATTALVLAMFRMQMPLGVQQGSALDGIDPAMTRANDAMMIRLNGDVNLTLNGDATSAGEIDVLGGVGGQELESDAGWFEMPPSGGIMYRTFTITIPVVVYDAWTQAR